MDCLPESHSHLDFADHEEDGLQMLSEEEWLLVFDKLNPPELSLSCQVCGTFEALLNWRRVVITSAAVLPILLTEGFLDANDIRQCRLVCQTWNRGLKEHLQSFESFEKKLSQECELYVTSFNSEADIEKFLVLMLSRPLKNQNPFLARHVEFNVAQMGPDEVREYWSRVVFLLEVFGKHIQYGSFRFYVKPSEGRPFTTWYNLILSNLFKLTPNLRAAIFHVRHSEELVLSRDLIPTALPPRIEWIKVSGRSTPLRVLLLLSTASAKLESLTVKCKVDPFRWPEILPRVRGLKQINFNKELTTPLVASVKSTNWSIVEASLEVELVPKSVLKSEEGQVTFSTLFEWLNQFGGTLESLTLHLTGNAGYGTATSDPDAGHVDRLKSYAFGWFASSVLKIDFLGENNYDLRLRLSRLKQLKIVTSGLVAIFSVDFLQELSALEIFCIQSGTFKFASKYTNPKERIAFASYEKRMLESNIWQVLPTLRRITLQDSYKRYQYSRFEWKTVK